MASLPVRGFALLAAVASVASGAPTPSKNCTRTFPNQPIDTGFPETYLPRLYSKCADEGGVCQCDGAAILGVPTLNYWSDIVISSGSVDCSAATFSKSLDVGKPRECWCKPTANCAKEDLIPYEKLTLESGLLDNVQSLGPGVELLSVEKAELFGKPQRFYAVYVDSAQGHKVDVSYVEGRLATTPELGQQRDALAGINGGFHAYGNGRVGTITQLKVDGEVIVTKDDPTHYGLLEENVEGVMGVDESGKIIISSALDESAWRNLPTYLHSGPLLLVDGVRQPLDSADPQNINHKQQPRSVVCSMNDGRSALIVVDGRYYNSLGVTLPQMMLLAEAMGMKSCLNLDGGGSTTMYVKDQGIRNQPRNKPPPCEDGWLDETTVRNISNSVVIV